MQTPRVSSFTASVKTPPLEIFLCESLVVRVGETEQTVIRYVQSSGQLQVDRSLSGNIGYDPATVWFILQISQPDVNGIVRLQVLLDECSVEVLAGQVRW